MKKQALLLCAAMLAVGLLAGCSSPSATSGASAVTHEEITTTADNIQDLQDSSVLTGWDEVASKYAALDSQAETAAKAINSSNVREQVLALTDTIVQNVPAVEAAVKAGKVDSAAETAAQNIYIAGKTLEALGNPDAYDVSLYINDIAFDSQEVVKNLYEGIAANVDARQSECDVNRDRIYSFTDEEWKEYAATL